MPKFVTKTDVVNVGKLDDIIRRFRKSVVLRAGKQDDIIQKFEKRDVDQVEESNPTQFSNLKKQLLSIDVLNGSKQNCIMRKFQKSDAMTARKPSECG